MSVTLEGFGHCRFQELDFAVQRRGETVDTVSFRTVANSERRVATSLIAPSRWRSEISQDCPFWRNRCGNAARGTDDCWAMQSHVAVATRMATSDVVE